MRFSELLNSYITERNMRSIDICEAVNKKKEWLSKVRHGRLLPPDWTVLHHISRYLQLSESEYNMLCDAYCSERFPPEHAAMRKAFCKLFSIKVDKCTDDLWVPCPLPANGTLLAAEQLGKVVSALLQTTETVHILGTSEHIGSRAAVHRQIFAANASISVEWLILLDKEAYPADQLDIVTEIIPLLLYHQADIRSVRLHLADHLHTTPFPLMLAFDSDVLLLRTDHSEGMYLNGRSAAAFIDSFAKRFQDAPQFVQLHRDLHDFLEFSNNVYTSRPECVYSIAKHPSLVMFASTEQVKSHMIENALFDQFMCMFQQNFFSECVVHSYFWEESVSDLLYSDEYYEYGKPLSYSISIEKRRIIFRNLIAASKDDPHIVHGMFRSAFSKDTDLFGINFWSDGGILLLLNHNTQYYIVTLHEPVIVHGIIRLFENMQRHGLLLPKEETLRFCEEKLREADAE